MRTNTHNHRLRSKQRGYKLAYLFVFVHVLFSFFIIAPSSQAELKALSQDELKSSTAQAGFTSFEISNTTARLFLDIHVETQAAIASLSAGWYVKDGSSGWDQKWNNVTFGNSTESLTIDGIVFRADFDDLSKADPVLQRIVIGSNRLQGSIKADFASFSGMYNDILTGGSGSPVTGLDRTNIGTGITFNFNSNAGTDTGLFFILNTSSSNFGIQVVAGYNENNIPNSTPPGPWWNSP